MTKEQKIILQTLREIAIKEEPNSKFFRNKWVFKNKKFIRTFTVSYCSCDWSEEKEYSLNEAKMFIELNGNDPSNKQETF